MANSIKQHWADVFTKWLSKAFNSNVYYESLRYGLDGASFLKYIELQRFPIKAYLLWD